MIGTAKFYFHVFSLSLLAQSKLFLLFLQLMGVLAKHLAHLNDKILTNLLRPQVLKQKVPLCVLLPENALLEKAIKPPQKKVLKRMENNGY